MDIAVGFPRIILKIVKEQELIVGPLAWDEARKVPGLETLDSKKEEVSLNGDPKSTIDTLVAQYERLFGRASHEVCREAVQDIIAEMPPSDVPSSLK